MLKKIKRKIKQYAIKGFATLILISNIVFSYSTAVHASIIDTYRAYCEGFFRSYVGMMFNTARPLYDEFLLWLDLHKSDYSDDPNETSEEFIQNNYTYTENNYTLNAPLINAMKDYSKDFADSHGFFYGYTTPMTAFLTSFSDQNKYHMFCDIIEDLDDGIVAFSYYGGDNIWVTTEVPQFVYSGLINGNQLQPNTYVYVNWEDARSKYCAKYSWNSSSFSYTYSEAPQDSGSYHCFRWEPDSATQLSYTPIVTENTEQIIIYRSFSDMQLGSEGQQAYYVTDSYNTSHVDNSVTISKTNIDNSITSTNVNNYINNYYNDNGKYPTPNDISIYINNNTIINNPSPQPTPTPGPSDPGTGGGNNNPVNIENNPVINIVNEIRISLLDLFGDDEDDPTEDPDNPTDPDNPENPTDPEDPDNPGGGSGSDDGEEGDNKKEGIIARILKVIKKLADTIITLLTGIADIALTLVNTVIGLITGAVTDLLDSINGLIDTFQGSLTNTAGQLIAYFIPFLPPEMTALIELFIVCCIIVGIIRLIRG